MDTVFLSHSSVDKQFVAELHDQIQKEFGVKVFASTRPDAIQSGVDWQENVITQLDAATVLIILITVPSENSVWVGFELGYFWKKLNKTNIHALYHPTAKLPSPLNTLQGKLVTDSAQLNKFFEDLGMSIGKKYTGGINVENLVEKANLISIPPPERSVRNFERLLEKSEWDKFTYNGYENWICADDALFQIVIDFGSEEVEDYRAEWIEIFPDTRSNRSYPVTLNIGGVPIRRFFFISADGARYFVPSPEISDFDESTETSSYTWRKSAMYFKVAKIIGRFYHLHPTLEDFADFCGILIE